MKLSTILAAGTLLAGLGFAVSPAQAVPSGVCPIVGSSTDCGVIITFNADGSITSAATGSPPFDNVEDTSIGVVNNSSHSISSIQLVQTSSGTAIFGFDGDGICTFITGGCPTNLVDTTGYGGTNAFFTGIAADLRSGTVNFITAIASGTTSYFSLEGPATVGFTPVIPEPATMALLGAGLIGLGIARRRKG